MDCMTVFFSTVFGLVLGRGVFAAPLMLDGCMDEPIQIETRQVVRQGSTRGHSFDRTSGMTT